MRLFAAIDIPAEVRENLRQFVARLKPFAKLNWSPVDNLHITTKFIGEWPEDRLGQMKAALSKAAGTGGFEISIRGVGWFPDARRPRVFWAGVEAGEPPRALAAAAGKSAAGVGVSKEDRDYSPHLTLARVREPIPLKTLQDALVGAGKSVWSFDRPAFDFGTFRATASFLYLSASGRYTKLAEFPLE
jgi:RNA 2',3'-cyclic 3'-phosphodiesterase